MLKSHYFLMISQNG